MHYILQALSAASLSCLIFISAIYYLLLLPPKYPLGIPAIPFWVVLIPLFKHVDQQDIYRKYIQAPIRKHGVVKIFFGSQWNVLVHRPAYLAQMFRREDQYQKSGNHKKIPGSVLASFLGDNIISAHGETWKLYQGIVKPALQRGFDHDIILANARRLCNLLLDAKTSTPDKGIAVQGIVQRYTIANLAQTVLGTDFETLDSSDAYLHKLQSSIKREIFSPIFMNFPFLDSLGLRSRERARRNAAHFTNQLVGAVSRSANNPDSCSRGLSSRLVEARESGLLTEKQFRDNVTVTFVAGQENPQLALLSVMYLLAKYPEVQERLRQEVLGLDKECLPSQDTLQQEMPLLSAVLYESLRLFPPIGQLINRKTSEPLMLDDGVFIPRGTYLGYNCYSTNRDPAAWGADADEFRPERWGDSSHDIQKEYRRRRARAEFISFHGGRRACLGERFALLQLRVTLFVVTKELWWRLDPSWSEKMTSAGPLCPRDLRLVIERR